MSAHLSYLIAEDEPLPAQTLRRLLETRWSEARCIGLATDGEQALAMIDEHAPDVVFLDVRMPHRDGLATAHALRKRRNSPLIVFVTAFGEYAVEAFTEAAIDYLLKPVDPARLDRCVARLRERLANLSEASGDMVRSLERLLAAEIAARRFAISARVPAAPFASCRWMKFSGSRPRTST